MKEVVQNIGKKEIRPLSKGRTISLSFPKIETVFLIFSVLIIGIFTLFSLIPHWIAPYSPEEMVQENILLAPSLNHLLGTDYFGRDVLSLVIYGSKSSLLVGVSAVVVSSIVGTFIGVIAGYFGGIFDVILMRVVEVIQTIPSILLALALAIALGPKFSSVVIAIAVAAIPFYARVMRAQIVIIKNRTFVLAARSIGTSNITIFFKHILPNSLSPLLVIATNGLGTAILTSAGLSFLGLGITSSIPDWGLLLAQGRSYLASGWWISTFPGLAIALFVLAVNIVGDSLRDYYDPKRVM